MRNMPVEINGWICTDPSDYQYQKKIDDNCFRMIQALEFLNDRWFIMMDVIDLDCYSRKDIEDMVTGFYNSIDELLKEYGENSNGIIAECVFESIGTGDYSLEKFVGTEEEAVEFVYEFMIKS